MEGPQVKALADRLGELTLGRKVDRIDVPADRWQANVLLKHCAGRHINAIRSLGQWLIWDFSHGIGHQHQKDRSPRKGQYSAMRKRQF